VSQSSVAFPLLLAEAEQNLKTSEGRLSKQEGRLAAVMARASEVAAQAVAPQNAGRNDVAKFLRTQASNTQCDLRLASETIDSIRRDVKAHAARIDLLNRALAMTDAEWEARAVEAAESAVETQRGFRSLEFFKQPPLTEEQEKALRADVKTNYRTRTMAQFKHDEERLRDEARAQAERDRIALKKHLPPKVFAKVTSSDLDHTPASKACAAWWDSAKERVFLLRGGIGIGKSVAAGVVAKLAVFAGLDVSWHSARELVSAVLHQYDERSPKLGNALVIVDDVGREPKPEDFGEALCTLLDDYEAKVLLTTNMTKDDFRARYDARLVDRLREVGGAVDIKGETRRRSSDLF
jgi:DNA replication protein DnaC